MVRLKGAVRVITVLGALTCAKAWAGQINVVTNGDFSQTSMTANCPSGQTSNCADQMTTSNVTGWSTSGYNFIYNSASTTNEGTAGYLPTAYQTSGGAVPLYNALGGDSYSGSYSTAMSPPTGAGTNFVGADGAYEVGAITQTISNLVVGDHYQLSFWYAGTQQYNFTGVTTEAWQVAFGGTTYTTPVLSNQNHSFTGWYQQTFTFTATTTSQVLSFLAVGTPSGEPPFSLLDGVTMYDVPEPGTWALSLAGLAGLVIVARRKKAPRAAG